MAEPLTTYERKVWKESAEDILANPENYSGKPNSYAGRSPSWKTLANNRLRYERTIQDIEAQRDALVTGILSIDEWMSGRNSHICPFCKGLIGEHREGCLRRIAEAIKEATDA